MKVLVIGGGIAGMATAIGLRRKSEGAIGVDLAELSGQPVGAAITMMNRALDTLTELGVYEELAAVGTLFRADEMRYYDAAGHVLPGSFGGGPPASGADVAAGPSTARPSMGLALYRPELAQVLSGAAAGQGVNLLPVGLTITGLVNSLSGVEVVFTDGSRGHYDLVVGADGIRSAARRQVFGDRYQPRFLGDMSLRWMVDREGLDIAQGFHVSESGVFVVAHLKNGLTYISSGFTADAIEIHDREQAAARLRAVAETFTNPAMKVLRDRIRPDSDVVCRASQSLWIEEPWYRERVVVIGDGAHATTPHLASGGGMALEDGVVLAAELVGAATVNEGLDRFYQRRRDRVADVVRTTLRLDQLRMIEDDGQEAAQLRARAFARLAQPY